MNTKQIDLTGAGYKDTEAIAVGGVCYSIGVGVRRWDHPRGLNAYLTNTARVEKVDRHTGKVKVRIIKGRRYAKRQAGLAGIRQLVIHHSGGDREDPSIMYQVLHNQRKLSVQFALEDGGGLAHGAPMLWQFLDAIECAWHAGGAFNQASVGVECALYPEFERCPDYYSPRGCLKRKNLPHPVVEEVVHGVRREVFGMPDPQLMALAKLWAGVWTALRLRQPDTDLPPLPKFPRVDGAIPRTKVEDAIQHTGMIGHLQITRRKVDPAGFPWETFEDQVEQECRQMAAVAGLDI